MKKLFVVCKIHEHGTPYATQFDPKFYAVCSTQDRAQIVVDKLTERFGPTFVIIEAPLDP